MSTTERNLTTTEGIGMLKAIQKYYPVEDHIKQRVEYYLNPSNPIEEKLWWKKTEGSFFTSLLAGDIALTISRGDKALKDAICTALINNEI